LHPPISMSLPRIVPKDGTMIDNHFLAAGTEVSVSPYIFHRTNQAYGQDARTYNPNRWLNVSDDQRRQLEKHNLTFGGGSRQCIGKNISLMELSKVLPTLLRTFTFSLPSSPRNGGNHLRRDCDGSWSSNSPWNCDSTWFLDAKVSKMFNLSLWKMCS
jgi:cytochrome P450